MWKADLISENVLLYLSIKCYWIWWITHQQHLSCRWLWGSRTALWQGSLPVQVHVPRSIADGNHAPCDLTVLWVEGYELFFFKVQSLHNFVHRKFSYYLWVFPQWNLQSFICCASNVVCPTGPKPKPLYPWILYRFWPVCGVCVCLHVCEIIILIHVNLIRVTVPSKVVTVLNR